MDARRTREVVSSVFGEGTGPHYDRIVELATRGRDRAWKEAVLARLRSPGRVLDLACGTGILTFMVRERFPEAEVVGVDLNPEYLDVARERARRRRDSKVEFRLGLAEEVALDGTFDAIVTCYLPKYADLPRLVPRLLTRLAAGGLLMMQDFVYPRERAVARAWEWRFAECRQWAREHLPEATGMFEALPAVIRESAWVEELTSLLTAHGMTDVACEAFDHGTAAIVWGFQSAADPGKLP